MHACALRGKAKEKSYIITITHMRIAQASKKVKERIKVVY